MLAAALNAFFGASPIYGSADDFTSPLNFTPYKGVTPAAKQQVGETRKKPNSSSLYPPQAAVVAVALFSRFSHLLLRSRLYALAERKVLRKRNTIGGAVNRRSTKNAFSAAASIFVLRQLLRGLKGASSPFLVDPARRNRWWFSGSLLTSKENNST